MAEENKGFFKGLFKKLGIGGAEEPAESTGEQSTEELEQQEQQEAAPIQEPTVSASPAQAQSAQPVVTPVPPSEPSASAPRQLWTEPTAPAPVPVSEPVEQAKPSFFERLKRSLSKTHETIIGRVDTLLLGKKQIDTDTLEELEEILITADLGVKTTVDLIRTLEQRLKRDELQDGAALKRALKEEIQLRLLEHHAPLVVTDKKPFVIMVIGVNGVGKTTTIGKLAARYAGEGRKVLLAAADTFRAAAAEQLETWANRVGADIVRHKEGADPSAVVFDACKAAIARGTDVLIIDTAGRMHTKVNLMEEMKKIRRVLTREIPDGPHETLLVLDAATGQNALSQAKLFKEAADVTGVVLTKLDGSAKGGIVVAVSHEYALPVRFIGVGESVEDLRAFDPVQFVEALFQ
ncbi:signal recognition particle-docking protein FtsY [Geomonas nitrogeniifigens]|uniref:signal recognition particle-docking protein FtsY n=1 Tax=Geomonas diazotrophica TaxID=2843197 RepID=UPI001C2BFDD4|nr:signal recognition particle-docking protein FtsY [Geomonas nitrogeniifigens]QXE85727.1 signal recognition particle-docking protein FtsY [Geomonas nitrogeniifigens]